MKNIFTALVITIYLLSGIIAVLAAPTSVISSPALFALINTDTSRNNTVTVHGDRLSFHPGRGMGGNMYGFQPNSVYYYKDLFKVKNITSSDLSVWYTLDGQMKKLNADGIISLSVAEASGDRWNPGQVIVLPAEGETGGVDFLFTIPSKQTLGSYGGSITVHAAQDSPVNLLTDGGGNLEELPGNQPDTDDATRGEENTGEPITPVYLVADNTGIGPGGEGLKTELALAPEAPQTIVLSDETFFSLSNWPYLLIIPTLLFFFLMFRRVLILVPAEEGKYKVVARKFAWRRNKKWFINIEKQLDKYLEEHGLVAVDFRGGLLKRAEKSIYSGKALLGASDLRYALISNYRYTTWVTELSNRHLRQVG